MHSIRVISFVVAAMLAASANSQDLNGTFLTGYFEETFKVHNNWTVRPTFTTRTAIVLAKPWTTAMGIERFTRP
jgi:hypothetical protein